MRNPPASIESACSTAAGQAAAQSRVGQDPDEQRERAIRHVSQLMAMALARYERTGCFADKAEADRYGMELEDLKRARPALAVRLGVGGQ